MLKLKTGVQTLGGFNINDYFPDSVLILSSFSC